MQASRPRCVVLPIVSQDPLLPSIGLAIHFLFGNVVVLNPLCTEFWFGWRVAKIFPSPTALTTYCRTGKPSPEPIPTGRREDIRLWITGMLSSRSHRLSIHLALINAETEKADHCPETAVDVENDLIDLRRGFMAWLAACDLPFPKEQEKKSLWPEKASTDGLNKVGRALETFYLQSAYGGQSPIDLAPFQGAVAAAPSSFMAHDLLGWAFYRNGAYKEARQAFLQSVQINAHGAGAMAGLMWCGVMAGDEKEAVHWASRKADACGIDGEPARQKALRLLKKYADTR